MTLAMPLILLVAVIALAAGLQLWFTSWSVRRAALRRVEADQVGHGAPIVEGDSNSWLPRWLAAAGFRAEHASTIFVATTAGGALAGLLVGQFYRLRLMSQLLEQVANIPGSAGDVLSAVLQGGPWIIFVLSTLSPTIIVRSRRRARVTAIEQDLPLALELFATMAEAGLGFDGALEQIVRARGTHRPLIAEFVNFQLDMVAGVPRGQALRQLARRVDVPALTGFASALIQAEQVGASMAETLQHQATDLRQRRREDALLQAQALPVKLVFPLVICFLPGIFISTLAPVIYQMIQVADSVVRPGP